MATANPTPSTTLRRQPRWRRRLLFWGGLAVLAALVWLWRPIRAQAVTASAYAARVACPCRFIAGRDLSDCRADFAAGTGFVMLSEDKEDRSVTAWIPLLASQTASFREGEGCRLEPWEN